MLFNIYNICEQFCYHALSINPLVEILDQPLVVSLTSCLSAGLWPGNPEKAMGECQLFWLACVQLYDIQYELHSEIVIN